MPFESALHRSRRPLQRTRPAPDRRLCKPRADPDTHPGPAGARGDRRTRSLLQEREGARAGL
jgi:hypothetical protein